MISDQGDQYDQRDHHDKCVNKVRRLFREVCTEVIYGNSICGAQLFRPNWPQGDRKCYADKVIISFATRFYVEGYIDMVVQVQSHHSIGHGNHVKSHVLLCVVIVLVQIKACTWSWSHVT